MLVDEFLLHCKALAAKPVMGILMDCTAPRHLDSFIPELFLINLRKGNN